MPIRPSFFEKMQTSRTTAFSPWRALVAMGILVLTGCSQPPAFEFDEFDGSREQALSEFSLGKYQIPVSVVTDRTNDHARRRNWLRFDFELHALVAPSEVSHLHDDWERREGVIRDRVMRICRNATVDDLQEPELTTLKARLMDALQAELGDQALSRLLLTEVVSLQL